MPTPTPRPQRRRLVATAVVCGLASLGLGVAPSASAAPTTSTSTTGTTSTTAVPRLKPSAPISAFAAIPKTLPDRPGDLIRLQDVTAHYLPGVRSSATATRFLYRSTDNDERAMAVSATLLQPRTAWKGEGPRPIVLLTPGTQGMADRCAPSRLLRMGLEYESLLVIQLVARGYTVVVPDYEGVGVRGQATYAVRKPTAYASLDAVRAALRSGLLAKDQATAPIAVTGYSQGGQASAASAELAPTYAPELNLVAAYAGAPIVDLPATSDQIDKSHVYTALIAAAVLGVVEGDHLDVTKYLSPAGKLALRLGDKLCTPALLVAGAGTTSRNYTADGKPLSALLRRVPEFRAAVDEQRLGQLTPTVPVHLYHSRKDDTLPYAETRKLADTYCKAGVKVTFSVDDVPTHLGSAIVQGPTHMLPWLDRALTGRSLPNDCGHLPKK